MRLRDRLYRPIGLVLLLTIGCFGAPPPNQEPAAPAERPEETILGEPTSTVLLLGTFDLGGTIAADANAESDLNNVIKRLLKFAPSKVAVDETLERQAQLDKRFTLFRKGKLDPDPTALDRIAMPVAAELDHMRLWSLGSEPRVSGMRERVRGFAERSGQSDRLNGDHVQRYDRWFAQQRQYQTSESIRDNLVWMNDRRHLLEIHGRELVGEFDLGEEISDGDRYVGPDSVTEWYNRHLRMFANLQRLSVRDGERILVIADIRHIPLLRHAVEASPRFRLAEVDEVLGVPRGEQRQIVPLL